MGDSRAAGGVRGTERRGRFLPAAGQVVSGGAWQEIAVTILTLVCPEAQGASDGGGANALRLRQATGR